MDEPKSLDSLFTKKIFRIPDYQRGYAWQEGQLKAFWEDLINLSDNRKHYTGVLTLKLIPAQEIETTAKEYWLIKAHSYKIYHIVDGQQRLTTFIVLLQALVDFIKSLKENIGKKDEDIYLLESLSIGKLQECFLFETKPTGDRFRTYKFGYTEDNPSFDYLRYKILGEEGGGAVQESFYTLNLWNAKLYFREQFSEIYAQAGINGIQEIYEKLTQRFLFNEYIIKDEFDVFVAFETMNNRGKKLSDLELLKNRLIYLTTLYTDEEMDAASRNNLRNDINDAWKEIYKQLGRNKIKPLNDDEFLRAHWIMYYKYSRQTGWDYIRFLLDEQFTQRRIHKKIEKEVKLEQVIEQKPSEDFEDEEHDSEQEDAKPQGPPAATARLSPIEIKNYVLSLKECAVHWFNTYYPHMAERMSEDERRWIEALNRLGVAYFRPLMMTILKKIKSEADRVRVFQKIERFIFLMFRTTTIRSNYRSSEFYIAAKAVDQDELTATDIEKKLEDRLAFLFEDGGSLSITNFHGLLENKFKHGGGYYSWSGLRYFLYEYELSTKGNRQKKVDWADLLTSESDKISIEHIYPQTETDAWANSFAAIPKEFRKNYNCTLGNLLLLSMSINSSLQNDSFDEKKRTQDDVNEKRSRNGYSNGSHSEIEVSGKSSWGPTEIRERGIKLLKFMERRWGFSFKEGDREKLLFLPDENSIGDGQ